MARHHADDSERDRRHDDERREIALELRHHQDVDQHQSEGIGEAHVAESLVGHLPFAVPLQAEADIGVGGLADEIFGQRAALFKRHVLQVAAHAEQAVQRRIQHAAGVAEHEHDGQQILVVDGLFARARHHFHQLGQRHQIAVAAAHGQLQQFADFALSLWRQRDAHRDFVLGAAAVDGGDVLAGQPHLHRLDDVLLRHACQGRLVLQHAQHEALGVVLHCVVDRHDAIGLLEHRAHLLGDCHLGVVIGAVDFGDDGRHHRRTGRHFDHLDVGAVLLRDGFDGGTERLRDVMALAVAFVLVDQIDLQVAHLGAGAQVILPHQAVEVDRRRGAGVGLVVGDLGRGGNGRAHFREHLGGLFQRRADRQVDDDLEFRLVVERQHFHDDQLHHRQRDRNEDGQPDAQPQHAARATAHGAVQEGRKALAE